VVLVGRKRRSCEEEEHASCVTRSERRQGRARAGLGQEESRLERGPRKHLENLGIPKIKEIGRKDYKRWRGKICKQFAKT
jgi:hypothetical protein